MGGPPTYTHQVWRDPSKDLGGDREQTNTQTNKRCSNYSMIHQTEFVVRYGLMDAIDFYCDLCGSGGNRLKHDN